MKSLMGLGFVIAFAVPAFAQKNLVCDDLFAAACTSSDGKSRYDEQKKKNEQLNLEIIDEAQNRTVKAMGFKDMDDALFKKFAAAKLPLQQPVDPTLWKDLKQGKVSGNLGNAFTPAQECSKGLADTQKLILNKKTAPSIQKRYQGLISTFKEAAIPLYAHDVQDFFNSNILASCNLLKNVPDKVPTEKNPVIKKVCDRIPEIRRILPELRRAENTAEYQKRAEAFVREFWVPRIQEVVPTQAIAGKKTDPSTEEVTRLLSETEMACVRIKALYAYEASKIARTFLTEVNTSQPTVDYLTSRFYSRENAAQANQILADVKAEVENLVQKVTPSKTKQEAIQEKLNDLQLRWINKLDASRFKPGTNGVPILDFSKDIPANLREEMDRSVQVFADPGLNYFKDLNADYRPDVQIGIFKRNERVNMMPAALMNMQRSPQGFISLLAHEVGHKIDPNVSQVNGYDLKPEYSKILECFKSEKSIRMGDNQMGETMADYISAEVLAKQLQRVSPEKRAGLLLDSMSTYCLWDAGKEQNNYSNSSEGHPDDALRVSGIFGANPNLRQAIGCEGPPAKFQLCGMPGLEGPSAVKSQSSQMSSPPSAASSQPEAQGKEGVR